MVAEQHDRRIGAPLSGAGPEVSPALARRRALVMTAALALAATSLPPTPAAAHVAPAVRDNNRYLVVAPLGDRIRLRYTIFYGELPGLQRKQHIDVDGDGTISEAEAEAMVAGVAREVAAALDVRIDGNSRELRFRERDTDVTSSGESGAFRIDLGAELCLGAGARHRLELIDGYRLDRPGEGELRLTAAPGIRIHRAGPAHQEDALQPLLTWTGEGGPIADPGYALEFSAGDEAFRGGAGCPVPAESAEGGGTPAWLLALIGAGILAIASLSAFVVRRRLKR